MAVAVTLPQLILPAQANHYDTLFGGDGVALMVRAAFVAAGRAAQARVVLAACHEVRLLRPVPVGCVLTLTAEVVRRGCSSLRVQVAGHAERAETGDTFPACTGEFTLVAVDDGGHPVPLSRTDREPA